MIEKGVYFPDQRACTKAMRRYAVEHNMTVKMANKNRGGAALKYKCVGGDECRFEVTMLRSQAKGKSGYFVSHCNLKHNKCVGRARLTASQVREDQQVRDLVAKDPEIAGRLLVAHVKRTKGATLSLGEAYRARKLIAEDLFGSADDGFQKMESLVDNWARKNPTSFTACAFTDDGEFSRVFVSHPYAPRYESSGMKIAGVDGAVLPGKHGCFQMALVGKDGNDDRILLAVGICSAESDGNYEWFLRCCVSAGVKLDAMPVFADRHSGVTTALRTLNVRSIRYCTRHIHEDIKSEFKEKCPHNLEEILERVQAAKSPEEYNRALQTVVQGPRELADYVRDIGPEHWVLYTALRSSRLYGWHSTNFVASQDASTSDPFQMLQDYMGAMMREAYDRREKNARRWREEGHDLTEYARNKLDEAAAASGFCEVEPSDPRCVYVYDTRNRPILKRAVDVDARTCSCAELDQHGIPCKHFIAALDFLGRPAERFTAVDECYKIDVYSALYGGGADSGIRLVLNEEMTINPQHHQPKLSAKPGRRKERPPPTQSTTKVAKVTRSFKCGECGEVGHNRRSCPRSEPNVTHEVADFSHGAQQAS